MLRIIFVLMLLSFVKAQENQEVADTVIALDAVNILKNEVFSAGHILEKYDADDTQWKTSETLGNALSKTTAIPFRNYGNGMLSSISVRGLAPSHTGIFWEGLPLNSTLNGQVDLNLFGTQTFDQLTFRKGGGSALFGSGAIGGSFHLSNKDNYNRGWQFNLNQSVGSFGLSNSNLNVDWGNKKWSINTSAQYLTAKNDYNVTTLNREEQPLENASVELGNFQAQIGYKINKNSKLKLSAWQNFADRDLPGTRGIPNSNQNQKDNSTRLSLQYELRSNKIKNTVQAGFLSEEFEYLLNKDIPENLSESDSKSWLGKYDFLWNLENGWKLNAGALVQTSKVDGTNHTNPTRTDWTLFTAINKRFNQKLNTSFTLHKGISNRYNIPFTLDFGFDYQFNKTHKILGNFTTNYRTPTFNDLFWNGLGNPDLESESSWMTEASYQYKSNKYLDITFLSTIFYGDFDNWIVWLPDGSGIFRPINIYEVENYGLESQLELKKQWQKFSVKLFGVYQYVKASNKETDTQLIYTPEHSLNSNLTLEYKKIGFLYTYNHTGKTYTTRDESQFLEPFSLSNITVYSNFKLLKTKAFLSFSVNNIFDKNYETNRGYELPGINYNTTIQIKF